MHAVLFVDRPGTGLKPLTDRTALALLPVAGKPVVEYAIESLVALGLRQIFIVTSPHADLVEQALGPGARWGATFEYVVTRGEAPEIVLDRLRPRLAGRALVIRGDILRSEMLADFLGRAFDVTGVADATAGHVPLGIHLLPEQPPADLTLPADPEVTARWRATGTAVDCPTARYSLLDSCAAYHATNLDVAAGRYPGLALPGAAVRPGLVVGRHARVPPAAARGRAIVVGPRCRVHRDAELLDGVVLSRDVVVDRRATLADCVVLPHTYIGELVELRNAIAWSNLLIRVDTGATTPVADAFLLADLRTDTIGRSLEQIAQQGVALLLLVASIPLWIPLIVSALLADWRRPFRRVRFRGGPVASGRGAPPFDGIESASPVPLFRWLPLLLAAVSGRIRLVGVRPLPASRDTSDPEDWERLRDEAPVGVIGPRLVAIAPDASEDECVLAEGLYARTRSRWGDVRLLLQAAPRLFHPSAWRRRTTRVRAALASDRRAA